MKRSARLITAAATAGLLLLGTTACNPEVEGLEIETEAVGGWQRLKIRMVSTTSLDVHCAEGNKLLVNGVEMFTPCDRAWLDIEGSPAADDITVTFDVGGPTDIRGGDGDDSIEVTRMGAIGPVVFGDAGDDTLVVRSPTSSSVKGGAGDDFIWLEATATPSTDRYDGRFHSVEAGDGRDVLVSSVGYTTALSYTHINLDGNGGDDTLIDLGIVESGPLPDWSEWATVQYTPGEGVDIVDASRSEVSGRYVIEHQDIVRFGTNPVHVQYTG